MRPGRQLAVLGLLFVILYLMVFFVGIPKGGMSFDERLQPRRGMDLVGGTRVVYQAQTLDGQAPPKQNLEEARGIIDARVNGLGVSEAEVVIEGDRNIVVSLAGKSNDLVKNVGQAAQLRFRKVLKVTGDNGPVQATPAPSGSAAPAPGGSAAPKPATSTAAKPAAKPSASSGGQGGGAPAPSASAAAPAPSTAPSSAPSAAPVAPDIAARLAAVRKKVGEPAWGAATALQAPSTDPAQTKVLAPFEKLTGAEVFVLPAAIQFNVPAITCQKLAERPAGAIDAVDQQVVGCEGGAKYFMDVAKVQGTDIKGATPQLDGNTNQWVVSLDFKAEGQEKWTALTREAFNNTGAACEETALGDQKHCLVAVVLDKEVVSAPQILGVLSGQSQISGSFTAKTAADLANQLKFGALPLTFKQLEARDISATLGTEQLRAGLLAAAIGMLLVAIYSFFYYRLLGSVIFLSLILSGLLTFGALVVLGRTIGFTLTLAGIAGFIVSLGVAADSFVIYFERLKDEIREGRSPRSAVPRAWVRARRTIISANTITILAAVVLYVVSVGVVQGFAFALGLSTILDLVVVFLFRHPIMTMFARTKAFMSPRVSGLGRVLKSNDAPEPVASPTSRVKEA
jgi:preprotein translocase subunit SecD